MEWRSARGSNVGHPQSRGQLQRSSGTSQWRVSTEGERCALLQEIHTARPEIPVIKEAGEALESHVHAALSRSAL